ncbi:MAG: arginyltransferase [Alphaproteobacteria bacterium]|nr:arginyltransferase [Alphaproteobacteria bacterium]
MTSHAPEQAQFYLTSVNSCPYLKGRMERKLFTHLNGRRAPILHDLLAQHGFRRSQNIIYRPACDGCSACQSARIVVPEFTPSKSQLRVQKRNRDIAGGEVFARASPEQFELFGRYLLARHTSGGMAGMTFSDYEYMIEDTPVKSMLIEYRIASPDGGPRLVGTALTDILPDGLSMVYSFFDPQLPKRSLGTHMILDHVARASAMDLSHVYLGYWVRNSPKMAYKGAFQPLETLVAGQRWRRVARPV